MGGDLIITGGMPLNGTVHIPAAKNSVLPLLAAALLCNGTVRFLQVPHLADVDTSVELLQGAGCTARWQGSDITVQGVPSTCRLAPEAAARMRASILFCAPLLARLGRVETVLPGGCRIGARPVDLHLSGLAQMGVHCREEGARLILTAPAGLHGADITLGFPSVGATETLLLAAAAAVVLAFGLHRESFFRQCGCFFLCNFLLAGLILAVDSLTPRGFAAWGNSCCYLNFSLFQLVLFTAAAYSLLHICTLLRRRHRHTDDRFQVFFRLGSRQLVLDGLADTGNNLTDTFSGTPVIVCSAAALAPLLDGTPPEQLKGYRLIPCATITAQGLLPLFRPDEVCIRNCTTGKSRRVDAMVGIGGTQQNAIFHPQLLE